jgi:sulfatase maturation enzyme AslB (radical SAM superfamily)
MWVKIKDGVIEDLHFTLSLTQNCNFHCTYCPLKHANVYISEETINLYIEFFWKYEALFKEQCKNIVIIFFGGEPMLESEKIIHFIEGMQNFWINIKYVIYSNGALISETFLKKLSTFIRKKIIFYISIDGDSEEMIQNRVPNYAVFDKIQWNIKLVREYWFEFSLTKVIMKKSASSIFWALKFLDSLHPVKLDFQPAMMYYKEGFSLDEIKEILKWLNYFIGFLKKRGLNELQILEYLGLPDNIWEYKSHFNVYPWFFCDTDGIIYGLIDGLSLFKTRETFSSNELAGITLWNIKNPSFIKEILESYVSFEERMLSVGLPWVKREYPYDQSVKKMMNIFFIKKLVKYRYLPYDITYGK